MKRRPIALAIGLSGAAYWFGPGLAAHSPPVAGALRVPLRREGLDGVALTFDDGPHPEGTPGVLEALERADAKATFFLVAEHVARHRSLVREIVDHGHEAAVHGYLHRNQTRLTPRTLADDLDRAIDVITDVCGRSPRLYRPPYGVFTPAGLALVDRRGLDPLLWSRWGRDWRSHTTPEQITALATASISRGDVVLLHDADWYSSPGAHRHTVAALPAILAELQRRGLQPVVAGDG